MLMRLIQGLKLAIIDPEAMSQNLGCIHAPSRNEGANVSRADAPAFNAGDRHRGELRVAPLDAKANVALLGRPAGATGAVCLRDVDVLGATQHTLLNDIVAGPGRHGVVVVPSGRLCECAEREKCGSGKGAHNQPCPDALTSGCAPRLSETRCVVHPGIKQQEGSLQSLHDPQREPAMCAWPCCGQPRRPALKAPQPKPGPPARGLHPATGADAPRP